MIAATVSRWGNSFGVRLPVNIINEKNIKEGDIVEMDSKLLGDLSPSSSPNFNSVEATPLYGAVLLP